MEGFGNYKIRCATNWLVWFWSCSLGYHTGRGSQIKESQTNLHLPARHLDAEKNCSPQNHTCVLFLSFNCLGESTWEIHSLRAGAVCQQIFRALAVPTCELSQQKKYKKIHHFLILKGLHLGENNQNCVAVQWRFDICSESTFRCARKSSSFSPNHLILWQTTFQWVSGANLNLLDNNTASFLTLKSPPPPYTFVLFKVPLKPHWYDSGCG